MVLLEELCRHFDVRPDRQVQGAFVLVFYFDDVRSNDICVFIRVQFEDRQSGADLVITNMATLPTEVRRKGFGTKALERLLSWANGAGLINIQAVQVQKESEGFWEKKGFVKMGNCTNDFQHSPDRKVE